MKFVWVVIGLALMLAGVGAACGPEEKYCYNEHMTCTEAQLAKEMREQEERDRIARELDAGMGGAFDTAAFAGP